MENSYNESMHNSMRAAHENNWDGPAEMVDRFRADGIDMNRYGGERSFYRGQPRTASGRFKRMRFSQEMEHEKEKIAPELAEMYGFDHLKECAIKEASELIKAATEGDEYAMFKEFAELCVIMKALEEEMPEGLPESAGVEAIEYYKRKIGHSRFGHERHPFEEAMRCSRRYR